MYIALNKYMCGRNYIQAMVTLLVNLGTGP